MKFLIGSAERARDTAENIRARFLTVLYLSSAVTIATLLPIRYLTDSSLSNPKPMAAIALICGLLLLVPYQLALRGDTRRANIAMLVDMTALIFGLAATSDAMVVRTLNYLFLLVLFASHFSSIRMTLAISALQVVGMLFLFLPIMSISEILVGPLSFHIIATIVTVLFAYYRRRIEGERQAQLAESEARYRKVSELTPNYAYSFRRGPHDEPIKEWITDAFSHITGYTWEEALAVGILPLYHPDDVQRQSEDLQRVYAGQPASAEYRIITKSGETRWVFTSRHPVWDAEKRHVVGYYGVTQDITERKIAQEQQIKAVLQRERLALVNDFVRAISHDFRTSLAIIETSRYLVQRGMNADEQEKAQPRLNVIQQYVFHMEEQLENLRSVAALVNLNLEPCDLNALIRGLIDEQSVKVKQQQHQIVFQPNSHIPHVRADVQELGRAIKHVVLNGLNYMLNDGTLTIRTFSVDQHVFVEIRDTGVGIPSENLPHIFDLFYRVETARPVDSGGVGLGLSIVRMILEAHGGGVKADSTPKQGSTFTLYLPAQTSES